MTIWPHVGAAVGILGVVGIAVAQEPSRPSQRFPPLSDTPGLDAVREVSARLHLSDLRVASRGAGRELRLWDGFGMGGVQLLILRETRSGWRASYSSQVEGDGEVLMDVPITDLPDTAEWSGRWRRAVAAGLLRLPPYPARDSVDFVVLDGFGAVIEWFDGSRYGVSGADNPYTYCSPDDRQFMVVLAAILDHRWGTPCSDSR